jgi:hypothetical protein
MPSDPSGLHYTSPHSTRFRQRRNAAEIALRPVRVLERRIILSPCRARSPGVPDAPKSVKVEASMPDAVELHVEYPDEDGGMPVIGYRVQHGGRFEDFNDSGKYDNAVAADGTTCEK